MSRTASTSFRGKIKHKDKVISFISFGIGKSRISVRVLGIVVLRTTLESPVLDFSGESKCLFGIVFRRNSKSDLQVCGFN